MRSAAVGMLDNSDVLPSADFAGKDHSVSDIPSDIINQLSSSGGLLGIFYNTPLLCAILAFSIAQLTKVVLHYTTTRQWSLERLYGPGGMPSSHSAFVVGLATAVGIREGTSSSLFAIAAVFALIVMYDACSIRLHAGRHASALNIIISELPLDHPIQQQGPGGAVVLPETLGHTPVQVAAGAAIGFLMASLVQGAALARAAAAPAEASS